MTDHLRHRVQIAQRFGNRIEAGDAVFMQGTEGIADLPFTITNGVRRELSGVNRFMLLQVMRDKGWSDPRFFTADQVREAGWELATTVNPIGLQYLVSTDEHGFALQSPEIKRFQVFNATEIMGVPPRDVPLKAPSQQLALAAMKAGFEPGQTQLREAVRGWLDSMQSELGNADAAGNALRVKLAMSLLEVQAELPLANDEFSEFAGEWTRKLSTDPLYFFECVKDGELLAAAVMGHVKSIAAELQMTETIARAKRAPGGSTTVTNEANDGSNARMEALFAEREAVLAVPFGEKDRAKQLGARWYAPQMVWFVPQGLNLERFREWDPRSYSLGATAAENMVIEEFSKEMASQGLDTKTVVADGEWHNVSVNTKKSKANKSGSYVLSLPRTEGASPTGMIMNHHTGVALPWQYEGALLTPEQKAGLRAKTLEREAEAVRKQARSHDQAAEHAKEILARSTPGDGHGYVLKKGISAEGLRRVPGSVLLEYEEFHGESGASMVRPDGDYLIVPMCRADGEVRAVQAINWDGSVKMFMRGAQKKGTMLVQGASSLTDLLQHPSTSGVAFGEGVATGASFRSGTGLPMVICFDAGNLETVVAQCASQLPRHVTPVLAIDDDQFHIEQSLGYLSRQLGVNPHAQSGSVVEVLSGPNGSRLVPLGDAIADGEWHQAPFGRYCMNLVRENDSTEVREIQIEAYIEGETRMSSARFCNRGLEAGRTALQSLDRGEGYAQAVLAIPEFASVDGRPTDWNDLAKAQGPKAIRECLSKVPELARLLPAATLERPAYSRAPRAATHER
ncbi:MAG: DUF5710 domain-containing protein [Pseudomonadota bacterium]